MSKRVGKDRSTISNYIRLLKLDPIIQSGIRDNFISMGHGRALINISSKNNQLVIYERIIRNHLSVRQTEKVVKDLNPSKKRIKNNFINETLKRKIKKLEEIYSLRIDLKLKKENGQLTFNFNDMSHLNKLINKLNE